MFGMQVDPTVQSDPDILVLRGPYHRVIHNIRTAQYIVVRDDAAKIGAIVDPANIGTMHTMFDGKTRKP